MYWNTKSPDTIAMSFRLTLTWDVLKFYGNNQQRQIDSD